MDGRFDEATLTLMRNLALQNAIQHGHAHPKALMGKLLGQRADLRSAVPAVVEALERIVSEVNTMDSGERRSALDASAPEMLDAKPKNVRPRGLPDLPDRSGDVVLRFAPNPNGPLSFGHSRGVAINAAYAKRHGGTFILRFDDTDTVRKPPLDWAYDHITEEVTWLVGSPPDRVVLASDRVEVYHAHAKALLEQGGAYVCRCTADAFRGYRESKSACPCRDRPIEDSNADWQQMIEGRFSAGEAVVRIRTAMDLPNPALRDWPALRIQDTDRNPHPRPEVGSRHKVWPLLDFQSAIEDHEQGVTHIIRGKDLMDSTRKQMLLYEHFGWTYPVTLYWGRVKVHEFGSFSTSSMREDIANGKFDGWDDARLPTLAALRRRGVQPKALVDFWEELGLTQKDIRASLSTLWSHNANRIDASAPRLAFVRTPRRIMVSGIPSDHPDALKVPRHPTAPLGERILPLKIDENSAAILVDEEDAKVLDSGAYRLKEWCDIVVEDGVHGFDHGQASDRRILHWLPEEVARPATLEVPEGESRVRWLGYIERHTLKKGDLVQLERIGYARYEGMKDDVDSFVFLH